jgi:N-acetylglucosamine-6-phosphate deacetylase
MEGPFISRKKRGGILPENIRDFSMETFRKVESESGGLLRMMTLAPDAKGMAGEFTGVLEEMKRNGIIPAFGHSNAGFDDLKDIRIPAEQPLNITHLFNGMSGVSHKEPGLALWALLKENCYVELNADGTHVHPWAVDLALKAKAHEKVILISDAVPASSMRGEERSGAATLRGRPLRVSGNGVFDAESGVLVGSNLLVKDMVKRMAEIHNLPVWEAVNMASRNPLRLLGMNDRGTLRKGNSADISVFDRSFNRCLLQIFGGSLTHPVG